ncbi:PspC domain-containing protein [Parabacteroides sp. OttesenSCG-928-G06]|nr:PspC domain-containing protein [Parabacteroides sp. OttesenSCG-928-G06]
MEVKKRLMRSNRNKMIAGVCGGIAEYLDLDPTIVRVAYVLLSIFTVFAGAIVYIVLWLVMPQQDSY